MNKKIIVLGAFSLVFANTWGMYNEDNSGNNQNNSANYAVNHQIESHSEQYMFEVIDRLEELYGIRFNVGMATRLFSTLQGFVDRDAIYLDGVQDSMSETMDLVMEYRREPSWYHIIDRWELISLYLQYIRYENGIIRIVDPNQ